eukprot:1042133-Pyramimonas_sp.AAC.1
MGSPSCPGPRVVPPQTQDDLRTESRSGPAASEAATRPSRRQAVRQDLLRSGMGPDTQRMPHKVAPGHQEGDGIPPKGRNGS